jgi:hypothetical protein
MPRIQRRLDENHRSRFPDLLSDLVKELKNARETGQPLIEEQVFPKTNAVRVTVIWDKWEPVPDEDRFHTILQAYEEVEGKAFRARIALAIGLTVPEAAEAGLLPFQITTALRRDDPVTVEQCREAMMVQGASVLLDPEKPQLRFATEEEAEACRQRLIRQLPGSEPVWVIAQEGTRFGG